MFDFLEELILRAATAWWMPLALFGLCVIDGFFPVVPSESIIIALAALGQAVDSLNLWLIFVIGWIGAALGDQIAFWLGRSVGIDRFRWMRHHRVRAVTATVKSSIQHHGAVIIITARHIPGGRVAVNFTAGAVGYKWWKFTLLDVISAAVWAGYSVLIGRFTSGWLDNVLLQILVALLFAGLIGLLIDRIAKKIINRVAESDSAEQL